ncbi:MAG: hypothetical protein AVDCRST_MAG41-1623 [uncultured Corynebacteriales bacterium]|uniref:DUF456 domain-containing protein n=1 Tax=uncultured Mycobacteriales bacterium TaxID=581187 RepID=A0A6J4I9Z3_9ACTN|nr:MAG: hypothetical protein AVDCRST_MAG41-1623 [uncultured Corynebacteriales bacterium]
MGNDAQTAVGVVMLIGLVGVLLPIVPGLLLIWLAGLWWTLADGGGPVRWTVLGVLTALLVLGTVVKYVLPARSAAARGAPVSTLAAGAVGALVGFFVIPVVGILVGGLAGLYLAEYARLREAGPAWLSTRAALVGIGIGVLVELATGVVMVAAWLIGVGLS